MHSVSNKACVLIGYPQSSLRLFAALLGLGSIGFVACSGGSESPKSEATSGGEGSASYEGPIQSTDAAGGKEKFEAFCGDCHPGGEADVGPSLIAEPHTPAKIRQQIREGSGKMRPFSEKRLSNADVETILAWLASVNAVK